METLFYCCTDILNRVKGGGSLRQTWH